MRPDGFIDANLPFNFPPRQVSHPLQLSPPQALPRENIDMPVAGPRAILLAKRDEPPEQESHPPPQSPPQLAPPENFPRSPPNEGNLKPFIPQGAPSPKFAPLQPASPQLPSPHPQLLTGADWHESHPQEAAGAGAGCWHSLQPQALLPISLPRHCARDCSLTQNEHKVNMSAAAHILAKNGDRIVSNPFENWVLSWRKTKRQPWPQPSNSSFQEMRDHHLNEKAAISAAVSPKSSSTQSGELRKSEHLVGLLFLFLSLGYIMDDVGRPCGRLCGLARFENLKN